MERMEIKEDYIRVSVKLKPEMRQDDGRWKCMVLGEEKVVMLDRVQWYCETIEEAATSFKPSEVVYFTITNRINYNHGN